MRYADIANKTDKRKALQQSMKRAHLYSEIWRDAKAIIRILLPDEMALTVCNHLKGILFNLIELKTGKRPDKI